jgi:hypothetical protein
MLVIAALTAGIFIIMWPGQAPAASASTTPGHLRAFFWARARAGDWYQYGAAGPTTFDCSGLVEQAYRKGAGISLPRDTFEMLAAVATGKLIPESERNARRGDLAFYGSGHVEFVVRPFRSTFGALEQGTRIGWHEISPYWFPTLFFRVRGAG